MKKNGFIATSIMFSFFLVFSMLSLLILATYSNYRSLINSLNSSILTDLNNVISNKYVSLNNVVRNGDFSEGTNFWNTYNSNYYYDSENQNKYMRMGPAYSGTSSYFEQAFSSNLVTGSNRKIYIAFKIFRNGNIRCGSNIYLGNSSVSAFSGSLCGNFINANWTLTSAIFNTNISNSNQSIKFQINNFDPSAQLFDPSSLFVSIKDIMVVDVTNLYKSGTSDAEMKAYLDRNLPYMTEKYPLAKH